MTVSGSRLFRPGTMGTFSRGVGIKPKLITEIEKKRKDGFRANWLLRGVDYSGGASGAGDSQALGRDHSVDGGADNDSVVLQSGH